MSSTRAPKSPYQKYNKTPHVYSVTYQLWKAATKKDGAGSPKALALSCDHAKQMRVVNEACVP